MENVFNFHQNKKAKAITTVKKRMIQNPLLVTRYSQLISWNKSMH